jgi:hypothetical protein
MQNPATTAGRTEYIVGRILTGEFKDNTIALGSETFDLGPGNQWVAKDKDLTACSPNEAPSK